MQWMPDLHPLVAHRYNLSHLRVSPLASHFLGSVADSKFAFSGDSHVYIFERVSEACRLYGVIPFTGTKANSTQTDGKDLTDAYVTQKDSIMSVVKGTIFEQEMPTDEEFFQQVASRTTADWEGIGISSLQFNPLCPKLLLCVT